MKSKRKIKKILSSVIPIIILFVGLSVMLYPIISDWWNSKVQTHAISSYNETVAEFDSSKTNEFLQQAHEYNKLLASLHTPFTDYKKIDGYEETLDISGTGIMGYISIPKLDTELVIYHGTSEEVLNIAAGHMQGTSLPVGGAGTHSVISAHRGLPSAKLFSDLDKLAVDDTFTITILDEILTYKVNDISIVEPHEINRLLTVPEKDYVTLMTCTPYGINTHRLLVRAERTDTIYKKPSIKVSADAAPVDSMLIVPFIALPLFGGLIMVWTVSGHKKRKRLKRLKKIKKLKQSESKKDGDS